MQVTEAQRVRKDPGPECITYVFSSLKFGDRAKIKMQLTDFITRSANAARLLSLPAAREAINAVIEVPALIPNTINAVVVKCRSIPLKYIVTRMPVAAVELWMMAVNIKPVRTANAGLRKVVSMDWKAGSLANSLSGPLMTDKPKNKMPMHKKIYPASLNFFLLENRYSISPRKMNRGANVSILNEMICAVRVVPIPAPMMRLIACVRFIKPALIKPMTITLKAVELWITAVTDAPAAIPRKRLDVAHSSIDRSLLPAMVSSPLVNIFIP